MDFREIFQGLPGNFIIVSVDDPAFTILAENDAHAAVVGVRPKDVVGKPVLEAFPDTSEEYVKHGKSALLESFRKVIKTKKPDIMPITQYDIVNKDGEYEKRYWRLHHYPLLDSNNKVIAVMQKNAEITDEVENKQRFQRMADQLDEALSIGKIGTWVWDLKHDQVMGDENLATMFGLDAKKVRSGLPILDFTQSIHPFDRERVAKAINEAVKKKLPYEQEYRTINQEGTRQWVLARGHLEHDEQGNPDTFPGVLIDITDRKTTEFNLEYLAKASAALSASLDYKKTLQKIAELAVPNIADWCSVEILDPNGELEQVAIAHREKEKVKWAKELRAKQGNPDMDAPNGLPHVIRTGQTEHYPEITDEMLVAVAKDKEELELLRGIGFHSAMSVPLFNGDKAIGGISLISTELKRQYNAEDVRMAEELSHRASLAITNATLYQEAQHEIEERERLEEELRNMNQWLEQRVEERTKELEETNVNLERSNRELENFAYVASHDLQEPLRKIQAFSNLLDEEYGRALGDGSDYLDRMRNAAARMSTLIDDLLAFSRVTTKGREFQPTNLSSVVQDVLTDLETRIEQTKGTVTVEKLPKINADPTQMRQLFQNLISNALKFHKPGTAPKVNITTSQLKRDKTNPARVEIRVADNGVGFDEKYLDRIFAVFQRLHGRDEYEGTGIGLAVCRKIVERHGGDITAQSTPGKGSTFIITLPHKPKEEQ